MVKKKGSALLMLFTDVDSEYDAEFNAWYEEEHLAEWLKVPGFLDAGRYQAVKGGPRYLVIYELESVAVTKTDAFKEVIQNPSEKTKRLAPTVLGRGTVRSLCTQIYPNEIDQDTTGRGMAPALQIGRMDVPAEIEAKYNDYYDNNRTPRNLTIPSCSFVRRYHVIEGQPKYLTMYEFEHENVPESQAWVDAHAIDTMHEYIGGSYGHAAGSPGVYRRSYPARPF